VATSGEIQWPATGSFPWPPSLAQLRIEPHGFNRRRADTCGGHATTAAENLVGELPLVPVAGGASAARASGASGRKSGDQRDDDREERDDERRVRHAKGSRGGLSLVALLPFSDPAASNAGFRWGPSFAKSSKPGQFPGSSISAIARSSCSSSSLKGNPIGTSGTA